MTDIIIPLISITLVMKIIKRIILYRTNKHFRSESPEKLLNFTFRGANNGTDSNEVTICNLALVYAYYGMYDKAEEQINVIDWTIQPNRLKSFERRYQAIIQYLQYHNFNRGLDFANESLNLGKFNFGKESYKIIIQVGELLNGDIEDNKIRKLERKFKRNKYVLLKLLIGWALGNVLVSQNRIKESEKYIKYCKETAPGCHPFHNIFMKAGEAKASVT